jgi:hypothetical protein
LTVLSDTIKKLAISLLDVPINRNGSISLSRWVSSPPRDFQHPQFLRLPLQQARRRPDVAAYDSRDRRAQIVPDVVCDFDHGRVANPIEKG